VNINAGCGAMHPEFAGRLVREHGADLGVSFDGDADRVLALCALALKSEGKLAGDMMACTVMSNLGLHEAMRQAGIGVVTTAVSDRHVIEALRKERLLLRRREFRPPHLRRLRHDGRRHPQRPAGPAFHEEAGRDSWPNSRPACANTRRPWSTSRSPRASRSPS